MIATSLPHIIGGTFFTLLGGNVMLLMVVFLNFAEEFRKGRNPSTVYHEDMVPVRSWFPRVMRLEAVFAILGLIRGGMGGDVGQCIRFGFLGGFLIVIFFTLSKERARN
jgi:hypothetical protein